MITETNPIDVLVVGEHRADVARSLQECGLLAESRPGVFPALMLLKQREARVVILGHDDVEGHAANPIEEIRAATRDIRVVLLHPESRRDDTGWLHDVGADEGLVEPCFPETLVQVVRSLIGGGPREDNPTNGGARPEPEGETPGGLEIIRRISRAAGAKDLGLMQTILVEGIGRLLGARRVSLMLHRSSSRSLFLVEGSGLPEEVHRGHRVPIGSGIVGWVAERARPVAVPDIDSSRFRDMARSGTYATTSFLCIPLVAGARVLGVLSVADRKDGTPFWAADLERILPIVDTAAAIIRNALLIRRLRAASMLDPLTGLYNRRYFDRRIRSEVKLARRYGHPLTCLLIDADRFKEINDAEGHPVGDEALCAIARTLRKVFRETDVLCRHGGDEFAVLMPETDREHARLAVERLHAAMLQAVIPGERSLPDGKLRLSCGLATLPDDAATPDDLIVAADRALYDEKPNAP